MPIVYDVEVQPAALRDMTNIVDYVSDELGNPAAASRLADQFVACIESLRSLPTRGALYAPPRPLMREYRWTRTGNYLVFFTVDEERELVTVARVMYARRDFARGLE